MIRTIIFDLDNCLAPADGIGVALMRPVFDAITAANGGTLAPDALDAAFADIWRHPLDWVSRTHGFSPAMHQAAWTATAGLEVTGAMADYGDLPLLAGLGLPLYLVTSGFRRLQQSKVRALGLAPHMKGIHIDAIDEAGHPGKAALFRMLLDQSGVPAAQALVVGDNPESEIAAGNSLGMPTVQSLRPGVVWDGRARFHIRDLRDLRRLLDAQSD
ncbi:MULTISPECIES: HAD family hydrolase [Nitrospirillum]|uniref:Putative hydrolase of the HAD superfamily n=1 Tax=Nitrospirillum amazonense TaxID=28077 RepID=A0A560G3Y4_9PROT|nr:HAD family hydrolase [Nitrospirillum amazonense]MEC4593329.1 HAD family hydrolase [Nitrospirillum amazonense]TWB28534.1 putative hydrolase of the HAD superfamily [Nitrospirillum amazonense]